MIVRGIRVWQAYCAPDGPNPRRATCEGLRALGLFLLWALPAQAATIHVDKDATGPTHDGSSWCSAYLTVQDALVPATPGTTIRVADGTYTPDQGGGQTPGDRSATFQLKNGVTLEGGYAGCSAPDPDARDIGAYETILSGDLNGDDSALACPTDCNGLCVGGFCTIKGNMTENSYHVVTGSDTDATAVLDGFRIEGGNTDGASPNYFGAGMYNNAGSPKVANCTFSGNIVYPRLLPGFPRQYDGRGGGLYNLESSPTVTNCTFAGNSAYYGGGIANDANSDPTVIDCTFSGNFARYGGGIANHPNSDPTLTDCTFTENDAYFGGGGMYNSNSSPTVTRCIFSGNSSFHGGAGMANMPGSPTVSECTFSRNSVYNDDGGGMLNFAGFGGGDASPTVNNCIFAANSAGGGGGIANMQIGGYGSVMPIIANCTFNGNSGCLGGAIYNYGFSFTTTKPTITNCLFSGNFTTPNCYEGYRGGGAIRNSRSSPTVSNCTFSGNWSHYNGGGMHNVSSSPTVSNSVFWSNSDAGGMEESAQIHTDGGTPVVNYSIVQGGWSGAGGIGVLDADPMFVDADGPDNVAGTEDDDLRLMSGSPAIDAADTTALPPDVTDLDGDADTAERTPRDLAGNPRVVDDPATADTGVPGSGVVDMGAYEFRVGACCDLLSGTCAENMPDIECSGTHQVWTEGATCADVECDATEGACCNHDPFGGCTDGVTRAACDCPTCEWTKLASCQDVDCAHHSIPTVSTWGLVVLTLLLLTGAKLAFRLDNELEASS